jgi:predicted RND superfamily exporter protein
MDGSRTAVVAHFLLFGALTFTALLVSDSQAVAETATAAATSVVVVVAFVVVVAPPPSTIIFPTAKKTVNNNNNHDISANTNDEDEDGVRQRRKVESAPRRMAAIYFCVICFIFVLRVVFCWCSSLFTVTT